MIVLVPANRFTVDYEVASGRPYSVLEKTMLQAIRQGAANVEALYEIFKVPRRLLIEALVTLTQAGWLAISGEEGADFLLTAEGLDALETGHEPRSSLIVESKPPAYVVMETLTGALLLNSDVELYSDSRRNRESETRWDKAIKLRPRVFRQRLDEGEVQHLLPRGRGEWVRSVGPIRQESRDLYFLPVYADTERQAIVGLPDEWRSRLQPIIWEEVRQLYPVVDKETLSQEWAGPAIRHEDPEAPKPSPREWPVAIAQNDILLSDLEHLRYIERALAEARSSIVVVSAFISATGFERLRGPLQSALQRGINVDLLWGYGEGQSAAEWLREFAAGLRSQGIGQGLRFNQERSGSHAKMVIWDSNSGYEACVGSFNWLSGGTARSVGSESMSPVGNASVILRHPGLVTRLCRCVAAFWAAVRSERLSVTSSRWDNVAALLDEQATRMDEGYGPFSPGNQLDNALASIVLDNEHEYLMRQWLNGAQKRLLVTSHKLGPPALRRLDPVDGGRQNALSLSAAREFTHLRASAAK